MNIYRTYFKLTNPVNDLEEARQFLANEDMTTIMNNDTSKSIWLTGNIISIKWILRDEQSGYIEFRVNHDLVEKELDWLANWVKSQHEEGLGYSFAQEPFAQSEKDGEPVQAEFDWRTNSYRFDLVGKR